jgi:heme/copper-type cytochrome/quinol oxidase subunit 2
LKGEWKSDSFSPGSKFTILKHSNLTIKAPSNLPPNCQWWNVDTNSAPEKNNNRDIIIDSVIAAASALILIIVVFILIYRKRRLNRETAETQHLIYGEDSVSAIVQDTVLDLS